MDWNKHEFVRGHMVRACQWVSQCRYDDQDFTSVLQANAIESPLEAAFLVWWQVHSMTFRSIPELLVEPVTQVPITVSGESFRLDVAFVPFEPVLRTAAQKFNVPLKVAIEFDGHEFHERSKEQVARRNHRDRVLQIAGWTALHFSGSEFHADPHVWVKPFIRAIDVEMTSFRARISEHIGLT